MSTRAAARTKLGVGFNVIARAPWDLFRRKLGATAYHVLVRLWELRDASGAVVVTTGQISKLDRRFTPRAAERALGKLRAAGLIETMGHRPSRWGRIPIRRVYGLEVTPKTLGGGLEVLVPKRVADWLHKAPDGDRGGGKGRGGAPTGNRNWAADGSKTIAFRTWRRGKLRCLAVAAAINLGLPFGGWIGSSLNQQEHHEMETSGRAARQARKQAKQQLEKVGCDLVGNNNQTGGTPPVSDNRSEDLCSILNVGGGSLLKEEEGRASATPSRAGATPPHPQPDPSLLDSRWLEGAGFEEDSDLGVGLPSTPAIKGRPNNRARLRGWHAPNAIPGLPAFPKVPSARIPSPPLLDEGLSEEGAALLLARSYATVWELDASARCWAAAPHIVQRGRAWKALVRAVEIFRELELAPAAWVSWSFSVWRKIHTNDPKGKPPIGWVFSEKRLQKQGTWDIDGDLGGQITLPTKSDLARRYGRLLAEVDAAAAYDDPQQVAALVARVFPEGLDVAAENAEREVRLTEESWNAALHRGEWIWTRRRYR